MDKNDSGDDEAPNYKLAAVNIIAQQVIYYSFMKTISLTGPVPALQMLSEVIQHYADAAYPVGGSECAQTARAGLLDTVEKINQQIEQGLLHVTISRRIKSHIKAAIQYYLQMFAEPNLEKEPALHRSQLMLAMLDGKSVADDEWL